MDIPDKLFFKIGEVASILGIETSVLRYWESEFKVLSPEKSKTGRRVYTKKNIELALKIKTLLYQEKYSIEGAKRRLRKDANVRAEHNSILALIEYVQQELTEIARRLDG